MRRIMTGAVFLVALAVAACGQKHSTFNVDVTTAQLAYDKASVVAGPPVVIVTAPEPYAYAASWSLPAEALKKASCEIRIKSTVEGSVMFGVLSADKQKWLSTVAVDQSAQSPVATITLASMADVGLLMLANQQSQDVSSKAIVHDIAVECVN